MKLSAADSLAIYELLALHGHLMDMGRLDELDQLFSSDVAYDLTAFGLGTLRGISAIRDAALKMGDHNPVGHHTTNSVITKQDDQGVHVQSKGIGVQADGTVGSVVYEDIVKHEADGWRIVYRKVLARHKPLTP